MKALISLKRALLTGILLFSVYISSFAAGEPSTYFSIYVPPNNDAIKRNVALIVTAIYDSTRFEIIDDGADGDIDDSKSGFLSAGQSYILYIKDNGINDDALYASGGTLKRDGDYFIIRSNNLMFAMVSTDSDWQHDWAAATEKTSKGKKFIIYSPKTSASKNDINIFSYEDSTYVTVRKISKSQTTGVTGYTNVNFNQDQIVFQKLLKPGQDIIYASSEGRDVLNSGDTYVIESNKAVTVQFGALWGNARDGGGYVPSSNGSSVGELFYFGVPYQSTTEQEIRVVSWNDGNIITLSRYDITSNNWIVIKSATVNYGRSLDWTGKEGNVTYATTFKVTCTSGKKVGVFEANWLETGNLGTSDIGTMVSSENGYSAGTRFLVYMAPPGNEHNVQNPFTQQLFGQRLTHIYLFSKKNSTITIKDAYTNGNKINRTYKLAAGRYIDCYLTEAEWKSIYNGTGTLSGPERPYIWVESDSPISVFNTNFNDNWLLFLGTPEEQYFTQETAISAKRTAPGDTVTIVSAIKSNVQTPIDSANLSVIVSTGATVLSSNLVNKSNQDTITGNIQLSDNKTKITYTNVPDLNPSNNYEIVTTVKSSLLQSNGAPLADNRVVTVETVLSGSLLSTNQQSVSIDAFSINAADTRSLIFRRDTSTAGRTSAQTSLFKDSTNSWTANSVDFDNDGDDDIMVTDYNKGGKPLLYQNNGTGTFTKIIAAGLADIKAQTVAACWGDTDNDGDPDVIFATNNNSPLLYYKNNGNGTFTKVENVFTEPGYYHGVNLTDFDNDGKIDLFVSNFMQTKFSQLWKNSGNGIFTRVTNSVVAIEKGRSIGATSVDIDNDGDMDLFIPNGGNDYNSLFRNDGKGTFSKIITGSIVSERNSTVASAWGDIDNDDDLDLYICNTGTAKNKLYLNDGTGNFTKIQYNNAVLIGGSTHGCEFMDVDNDGDLDLYVTADRKKSKYLFLNDGNGNFTPKSDEIIIAAAGNTMGQTWSDYNKDGFVEMFVPTHSKEPNYIYFNNGNANKYLSVKLIGSNSNKSAIGSRVKLKAGGKWQMRQIISQSGIGGQNSLIQHFGVASADLIDSIVIYWPSGYIQSITGVSCNQLLTINEPAGNILSGSVFNDLNGNCIKDANEFSISGIKMDILTEQISVVSDANGNYQISLAPGTYSITPKGNSFWSPACLPLNPITIINGTNQTLNVPLHAIGSNSDLSIKIAAVAFRKNFKNEIAIQVRNNGSENAEAVMLTLKLPQNVITYINSSIPVSNSSNGVYSWNLGTIASGNSLQLTIQDTVHSGNIGSALQLTGLLTTQTNEFTMANNFDTLTAQIVGAIDPNDMVVSPEGEGTQKIIPFGQELTYRIRFQNVGLAPVQNIVITNDIPENLDLATISEIETSHPATSIVLNKRKLIVTFNSIYLADSIHDEQSSHGYIEYSIKPLQSLKGGEQIRNNAKIQFESSAALETNTVLSTLETVPFVKNDYFKLKPNPAKNYIDVIVYNPDLGDVREHYITRIDLIDLNGKTLISQQGFKEKSYHIEFNYPPGTYYARITDQYGLKYYKLFVIR